MRKLSRNEFIERAMIKHNFVYDYSNALYVNRRNSITIKCNIHGSFIQNAGAHLYGQGCPKCSPNKIGGINLFRISYKDIKRIDKLLTNKILK